MVRHVLVCDLLVASLMPLRTEAQRVRGVAALTVATGLTAVALVLCIEGTHGSIVGLLLFGAACAVTELRPVHLSRGGERQSFTLTEGPLVVALALEPGRWIVLVLVSAVVLAQVRRQLPAYKLAFNAAQFGVATALACVIAERVPGDAGTLLGLVVFVLVNDGLVRLVLGVATGQGNLRPLAGASWPWLLHVVAISSTALLASHTYELDPAMLPAFAAPAVLILWSQEQSTRRRVRSSVSLALAEQAKELYAGRGDHSAALVARTVRELLAASRTELLALDGMRLNRTRDVDGTVTHASVSHEVLREGWPACVLAMPEGALRGHWIGIAVGGSDPSALIGVWRDPSQEPFRPSDLVLLSTLAAETSGWLEAREGGTDRPAVDLRDRGGDAAGALEAVRLVRQRLETDATVVSLRHRTSLADDLLAAEEKLSSFLADLVSPAEQQPDDVVVIGRWQSA